MIELDKGVWAYYTTEYLMTFLIVYMLSVLDSQNFLEKEQILGKTLNR